jgi:acyl-CoA synthetase (NDP forming)
MKHDLDTILRPKSVAVIGASTNKKKAGYRMTLNIIEGGYKGKVYPINPKGGELFGQKVYSSIAEVEDDIDLAVAPLPLNAIEEVMRQCSESRVKGVVIYTAGFGEVDEAGARKEKNLLQLARKGDGTRIIGPNCMGLICNPSSLNLTQSYRIGKGPIAFVSQSGNLGMAMLELAAKRNLGFSYFLSIGNQLDIQFYEYVEFLGNDPDTKVIALYIESINDGQKTLEVFSQTIPHKPIIVYKAGQTDAGSRSAKSHTGSIAGKNETYDAAFRQYGVMRVYNIDELLEVVEAFSKCPLPTTSNIAIIGGGGGHATCSADACERFGLQVLPFSTYTRDKLREVLLPRSAYGNPIDFAGASDENLSVYERCTEICLQDPAIGGVMIHGVFGGYRRDYETPENSYENSAKALGELVRKYHKPILVQTIYAAEDILSLNRLRKLGIPVNESVEITASCMAYLWKYSSHRNKLDQAKKESKERATRFSVNQKLVREVIKDAVQKHRSILLETEAKTILQSYGISSPPFKLATNITEAVNLSREFGDSVAMKVVSPDITHKSDVGAVKLNVTGERDIKRSFKEIISNVRAYSNKSRIHGIMISPMIPLGREVIIGMKKDPQFGPVIMFGLGGIFVEVLRDVTLRIAPLRKPDALDMVKEIKGYQILKGVRGEPPADIDSIIEVLLNISRISSDNPEISELDINPLVVYEKGACAVDARMFINSQS